MFKRLLRVFRIISKMLNKVSKLSFRTMLYTFLVCLITNLMSPLLLQINYMLVEEVDRNIHLDSFPFAQCIVLVLGLILGTGILRVTGYSNILLFEKMQIKIGTDFMKQVYAKTRDLPHAYFDDPDNASELERITLYSQDSMLTQNTVHIISAAANIISVIFIFPVLIKAGWSLFLIMTVVSVINNSFYFNEGMERYELQKKLEKDNYRKNKVLECFKDKTAVLEMKMLGTKSFIEHKWIELEDEIFAQNYRLEKKIQRKKMLYGLIQIILNSIPLILVTYQLAYKNQSVAIAFLVWQSQGSLNSVMSSIINEWKAVYFEIDYIEEVYNFLDTEPMEYLEKMPEQIHDTSKVTANTLLTADHISFWYHKNNEVIHNVSFSIAEKEKVAIVGVNGSGKTTLIKLLSGLYEPTKGTILYKGMELNQKTAPLLHQKTGIVWQDYVNFELSIQEAIGFGDVTKLEEKKRMIQVLEDVELEQYQKKLAAILGKAFDPDGIIPSGGQWQKIAIARGIFGDKLSVIMDEPTAALDPIAEMQIYQKINNLFQDKAAIFVSHRIGFARLADRILVMDNGRIVEDGSHEELIAKNGKYTQLFLQQAKWYEKGA